MRIAIIIVCIGIQFILSSCYSFTAVSIPPELETYYVEQFNVNIENAISTLSNDFSEALKDRIRTRSRLVYADIDPDIEFRGNITGYRVSSEAPQGDQTVEFNRLEITVEAEYINNKNEEDGWKRSFAHFSNFDTDQDLLSIQDDLVADITDRLVEDIYNAAFTNW